MPPSEQKIILGAGRRRVMAIFSAVMVVYLGLMVELNDRRLLLTPTNP
jgi:hypothetical protein